MSVTGNFMKLPNLVGWGSTLNGELGIGGTEEQNICKLRPVPFLHSHDVCQVAGGERHTVVLTRNGLVYSCGSNDNGQLGHDEPNKMRLQLVEGLKAQVIRQLSCGSSHTLAVNEWGQLYGWGNNFENQLISDIFVHKLEVPTLIKRMAKYTVVQVASGQHHNLVLTSSGELYTWGCNSFGQLGIGQGPPQRSNNPARVEALAGVPIEQIACGGNHCFAVSKSGAVYGWGKNSFGQLGFDSIAPVHLPVQLCKFRTQKVKYVSCGEDFSVFLTKDGGVFSCGAGTYGQLGHGINIHEVVPRKVAELMGSIVTQIACGRRHFLALVPSSNRIYSFGVGVGGQCEGLSTAPNKVYSPKIVSSEWFKPGNFYLTSGTTQSECAVVDKIFACYDHNFVTVTHFGVTVREDFRTLDEKFQMLCITPTKMSSLESVSVNGSVDQDTLRYLETVFASQECLNGSFFTWADSHFCCGPFNIGVDMKIAEATFRHISRIENRAILDVILTGIRDKLLPSLMADTSEYEALRLYITLPLYHEFENPKNYHKLQCAFSKAFLSIPANSSSILDRWWSQCTKEYLERLIRIYKDVVVHIFSQPQFFQQGVLDLQSRKCLERALEMLKRINKLNQMIGHRIPHDFFYIPELINFVDLQDDYIVWFKIQQGQIPNIPRQILLCNYSFLFNTDAKFVLLRTDQKIQMSVAINSPTVLYDPNSVRADLWPDQFLCLTVSRDNLIMDTINQLARYSKCDLKRPLKVKFEGEEAEDIGGVTKEFFLLLMREVLDVKYGMFTHYEESNYIWFSQAPLEEDVMFFLIGVMCGLAIYNYTIIELPFPLALYKKLLQEEVGLSDLQHLSPTLAQSLQSLLDYQGEDFEDVFDLTFEISREMYSQVTVYPLKYDGMNIRVTQENKEEFVQLYVNFLLVESVKPSFDSFHRGFHQVCGSRMLRLFHSQELMAVVVGSEDYNWEEMERATEYRGGYDENDRTIRLFWEVFHELSLEYKKMFLLFLTGSDRIPVVGMKQIKIQIQPVNDTRCLPVAHTCFNLLDLPTYSTKEKLRYKLLQAIQQTHGFSLV